MGVKGKGGRCTIPYSEGLKGRGELVGSKDGSEDSAAEYAFEEGFDDCDNSASKFEVAEMLLDGPIMSSTGLGPIVIVSMLARGGENDSVGKPTIRLENEREPYKLPVSSAGKCRKFGEFLFIGCSRCR